MVYQVVDTDVLILHALLQTDLSAASRPEHRRELRTGRRQAQTTNIKLLHSDHTNKFHNPGFMQWEIK